MSRTPFPWGQRPVIMAGLWERGGPNGVGAPPDRTPRGRQEFHHHRPSTVTRGPQRNRARRDGPGAVRLLTTATARMVPAVDLSKP
jgi:hypothetical protein